MTFCEKLPRFRILALIGFALLPALSAVAGTVTVTTVTDQNDGADHGVSLRDAVAIAEVGDNIVFDAALTGGTITLILGDITLAKNVRILGPGQSLLTVDGANVSRLFSVSPGAQVDLFGLNLVNGYSATAPGGGINNRGTLKVITCRVAQCASDTLGGGIYNDGGTLTVTTSTIASNEAVDGAGVYNVSGTTTIQGSLLKGNRAPQDGGGLYANGGEVFAVNSTFSGNAATGVNGDGAGLFTNGAPVSLTQATFFGNAVQGGGRGGGVYSAGNTTARNTLIAGNSTTGSGPDVFGTFISGGNNFAGDDTGSEGFDFSNSGTDLDYANTGATGVQDVLDVTLRDHGGPTLTQALPAQSPALDAGDNFNAVDPAASSVLNFDQRGEGFPRVEGDTVDIGAFELTAMEETPIAMFAAELLESFNDLDTSGDHALSFSELLQAFPMLTDPEFNQIDANGSGSLVASELLALTGPQIVHNADTDADGVIALGELLRVVQLFNADGYHCAVNAGATEDGYVPGTVGGLDANCPPHAGDYNPANGKFSLSELLRAVQLFQLGGYTWCPKSPAEDGFCAP